MAPRLPRQPGRHRVYGMCAGGAELLGGFVAFLASCRFFAFGSGFGRSLGLDLFRDGRRKHLGDHFLRIRQDLDASRWPQISNVKSVVKRPQCRNIYLNARRKISGQGFNLHFGDIVDEAAADRLTAGASPIKWSGTEVGASRSLRPGTGRRAEPCRLSDGAESL